MKLYVGGFRDIQSYTAAENEQEAIKQIGQKLGISHLPIELKEIDEVDGFFVELTKPNKTTKKK